MLVPLASGRGGITADNGNVELRTEPLSTWAHVDATIDELLAVVHAYKGKTTVLSDVTNTAAAKYTGKTSNRVVAQDEFPSKPQATLGVAMSNIETLFEEFLSMAADAKEGSLREKVANEVTTNAMDIVVDRGKDVLSAALDFYQTRTRNPHYIIENVGEVEGFMGVIMKTLVDAWSNSGAKLTDPKYAFPLMYRTDFKSMFASLSAQSQTQMRDLWNSDAILAGFATIGDTLYKGFGLDKPVFPGGYTSEERTEAGSKKRMKGPKVSDWLASIFTGGGGKDLLSPPPGFPPHGDHPEGLGAHGTDRNQPALSLFELRNLTNNEVVSTEQWKPLARIVSSLAANVQNDAQLRPPE